jgi:hypothetical protein
MKRILVLAIGLGIVLGTISFSSAQDTSGQKMSKKKNKKKKGTENK